MSLFGCGFGKVISDLIEQVSFVSPNMTGLNMQTQLTPSTQKLISDTRVVSTYKGSFKDLQDVLTVSAELNVEGWVVSTKGLNHVKSMIGSTDLCFNVGAGGRDLEVANYRLFDRCIWGKDHDCSSSTALLPTVLASTTIRVDPKEVFRSDGITDT